MQSLQRPLEPVLPPPLPFELRQTPAVLVVCSICLRVHRASGWVEAEEAIRELRTYNLRELVQLAPGLCDECSAAIAERRGRRSGQALAEAA